MFFSFIKGVLHFHVVNFKKSTTRVTKVQYAMIILSILQFYQLKTSSGTQTSTSGSEKILYFEVILKLNYE